MLFFQSMGIKETKRAQNIYPFSAHCVPTILAGFEKPGIISQLEKDYMETQKCILKVQSEVDREFDTKRKEYKCFDLTMVYPPPPILGYSTTFQKTLIVLVESQIQASAFQTHAVPSRQAKLQGWLTVVTFFPTVQQWLNSEVGVDLLVLPTDSQSQSQSLSLSSPVVALLPSFNQLLEKLAFEPCLFREQNMLPVVSRTPTNNLKNV